MLIRITFLHMHSWQVNPGVLHSFMGFFLKLFSFSPCHFPISWGYSFLSSSKTQHTSTTMPISGQTLGGQTKKCKWVCLCPLGTTVAWKSGKGSPPSEFWLPETPNANCHYYLGCENIERKKRRKNNGQPQLWAFQPFLTPQARTRGLLNLVLSILPHLIPDFWLQWGKVRGYWRFGGISKSDVLFQCACWYLPCILCRLYSYSQL